MRRVDTKIDWNIWYAFVFACDTVSFIFNLFSNSIEVWENASLAMQEFSVFYDSVTKSMLLANWTKQYNVNKY